MQTTLTPVASDRSREALLDPAVSRACQRLDAVATDYHRALMNAGGQIARAALLAAGIEALREAVAPEITRSLMRLQGSRLGFETDKEGGYSEDVLRDVLVEALLRGLYPVGNEINIIAGSLYVTQAGYARLLRELPGLTDLEVVPGVPVVRDGQTCVRVAGRWRYHGTPGQLSDGEGKPGRVFVVRVNQRMGADAIIGKAIRKALKAVYDQLLGAAFSLPDPDDVEPSAQAPP
jgi:hypothetical protein